MENEKLLAKNLFDYSRTIAKPLLETVDYPWEALPKISEFIIELGKTLDPEIYEQRGENVWVAKSAKVFDSAYLGGPLIICEDAEIRQCAFIRGNAIVGKGAVVGNSTELKNSILFDGVQTPHYNYIGDSILGYKSHTGGKNSPYIWLKCPNNMGSWEFFDLLLNEANVVGTPGEGFGENGAGYFRLTSFGDRENTIEAVERIKKVLTNLSK